MNTMGGTTHIRVGILTQWVEIQISEQEQEHNGWNNTHQSRNRDTMGETTHKVGYNELIEQEYKHISEQEYEHNGQNYTYQNRNRNTMGGTTHDRVGIVTHQWMLRWDEDKF